MNPPLAHSEPNRTLWSEGSDYRAHLEACDGLMRRQSVHASDDFLNGFAVDRFVPDA
jgi:hypothetical protein